MASSKITHAPNEEVLVGSLNCLGDALNPVEFIADDPIFLENYNKLEAAAKGLTWDKFSEYCGTAACGTSLLKNIENPNIIDAVNRFKMHCETDGKEAWDYFTEPAAEDRLEQDNKLLDKRINLLVFAFHVVQLETKQYMDHHLSVRLRHSLSLDEPPPEEMPITKEDSVNSLDEPPQAIPNLNARVTTNTRSQWELIKDDWWRLAIIAHRDDPESDYHKEGGAELFIWDLLCNVIASREKKAYMKIVENTHLNPDNFPRIAQTFVDETFNAAKGRLIALGLQEWPSSGSEKATAFNEAFEKSGLNVIIGEMSVAFAYSGNENDAKQIEIDDKEIEDIMEATIKKVAEESNFVVDKKARKGLFETTARKVMAVRMGGTTYVVMHCKDPKNNDVAKVVAKFVMAIGERYSEQGPWVCCSDANTGKKCVAGYIDTIKSSGFDTLPSKATNTTGKMRSVLHGQCYDQAKCKKNVLAPKDHIIGPKGTLSDFSCLPNLEKSAYGSLPKPSWASDHCLCTATYTPRKRHLHTKAFVNCQQCQEDKTASATTAVPPPVTPQEYIPVPTQDAEMNETRLMFTFETSPLGLSLANEYSESELYMNEHFESKGATGALYVTGVKGTAEQLGVMARDKVLSFNGQNTVKMNHAEFKELVSTSTPPFEVIVLRPKKLSCCEQIKQLHCGGVCEYSCLYIPVVICCCVADYLGLRN